MALSAADSAPTRIAVFLDRDGVINRRIEGGYVRRWEEFELIPGALQAITALHRAGYLVLIVTNQRGVARGLVDETELSRMHGRLTEVAKRAGGQIDAVYVCPHEADTCDCRKPAPGLIWRALADHAGVDVERSHMVGDSMADLEAGHSVGLQLWVVGEDHDRVRRQADRRGLETRGGAASLAQLVENGALTAALKS